PASRSTLLPYTTLFRSLQRHAEFLGTQGRDGFLQVIALLARDTYLLALNGSLDLELGVIDVGDDLLRQLLVDTFTQRRVLLHQLDRKSTRLNSSHVAIS